MLEVVRRYIGFDEADAEILRDLRVHAEPHFHRIVDHFYDCVALDPEANAVLEDRAQVERLKQSMRDWLGSGMSGPHDQAFLERRMRIGRRHVQIALPQRYMFTAMNVMRIDLHAVVEAVHGDAPEARRAAKRALDRWLDMELAIMLETYKEHSDAKVRRTERLASVGQLAGTIGHELRNPLAVIESSLYLLRPAVADHPRAGRHVAKIESQLQVAKDTITQLLEMTRERPAARASFPVAELVEEVLAGLPPAPSVTIDVELPEGLTLLAERGLVGRALANLVSNAVSAIGRERPGRVRIRGLVEGDEIVLEVADDGPGFDPDILPRAFEPLVTGRRDGIGLGLALVRNVCERHGATAAAHNAEGGGAVVALRFGGQTALLRG